MSDKYLTGQTSRERLGLRALLGMSLSIVTQAAPKAREIGKCERERNFGASFGGWHALPY